MYIISSGFYDSSAYCDHSQQCSNLNDIDWSTYFQCPHVFSILSVIIPSSTSADGITVTLILHSFMSSVQGPNMYVSFHSLDKIGKVSFFFFLW